MESNGAAGWLAGSLLAVDNNVEQLLKLIEENVRISDKDSEIEQLKKPELSNYVDELRSHYQLLAERYCQLAKEQGQNATDKDGNFASPFYTPESKFTAYKPGVQAEGSDILPIDLSYKNGSASSSTSSDSDLDNSNLESFTNGCGLDGGKKVAENGELLKRIEESELELRIVSAKLQSSEEDAAKFKSKLDENVIVVKQLQDELELARVLVQEKDAAVSLEKSKVSDLEGTISSYADEIAKYREEIQRLKEELNDIQYDLLQKEAHHKSDMTRLLEEKNWTETRFDEREQQCEFLEKEIGELKAEVVRVKCAHEAEEAIWKCEMKSLEAENMARGEAVETLNKFADALKLKHDTANARLETVAAESSHKDNVIQQLNERIDQLISEKAQVNAEICNLRKEQETVRQLEVRAAQSQMALDRAISESDKLREWTDKLRLRVSEGEEELEEQRALVAECAESKREAIRQLCMTMEYYKSGYRELKEAVVGKKRRPVA
uniref:NAB domain-containing protein n=1 Tax=Kalanchoe fedtschenkoi TaxID=63787 RepID=A0A7N0TH10_KALFE